MPASAGLRSRRMSNDDGSTGKVVGTALNSRRTKKRRPLSPVAIFFSCLSLPLFVMMYMASKHIAATSVSVTSTVTSNTRKDVLSSTETDGLAQVTTHAQTTRNLAANGQRPVLTAYLEDSSKTMDLSVKPLPPRTTTSDSLSKKIFPQVQQCSKMFQTWPIDDYPTEDPYLPWIHDVFPSADGRYIKFVSQNRRRCGTGSGLEKEMKFWEPQMALFQHLPVVQEEDGRVRLASSMEEATAKETRFVCRSHTLYDDTVYETLSEFPFNYEYVSWRKGKDEMFMHEGKDNVQFWLSQLLFHCPVPKQLQSIIATEQHVSKDDLSQVFLDLIPIRTPARFKEHIFTADHVGALNMEGTPLFNLKKEFGDKHYLPASQDSGRWANIPICKPPPPPKKKHRLVACTWTASAYTRRGDVVGISDTEARVREWILFHQMVGFDHVYIYDNTDPGIPSSLQDIAKEFPDFIDYHRWPCSICNNNRPSHKNPGERSSQYAAEASCRERYGTTTDWMAFIDTDEYLVPMADDTWEPLLEKMDDKGTHILKMRSSRAKPRMDHLVPMNDQSKCVDPVPSVKKPPGGPQECLEKAPNKTFLQAYNCEFIRPPRPERFERAMKQIYRTDHVQSHFVHYSTVTKDVSRYHKDFGPDEPYVRKVHRKDWQAVSPEAFLDELSEGLLVHTKSVLPHETQYRDQGCQIGSKYGCSVGILCPDSTPFEDEKHKENLFADAEGQYCNCWMNDKVEQVYVPKLSALLKDHMDQVSSL